MRIYVGNLDWDVTESGLRTLFEQYGTVDQVHVVTERETGRSRGFAFVEMGDSAQSEQAIKAVNGREFQGRTLNVTEARPKAEGGPRREGGGQRRGPRL